MKKILLAAAIIATFSGTTANAAKFLDLIKDDTNFHLICQPKYGWDSNNNLYIVEKESASIKLTRGKTGSNWSFASSEWKMTDTHYFGERNWTNDDDTKINLNIILNRISGRLDVTWEYKKVDGIWTEHRDSFTADCSKQEAQF